MTVALMMIRKLEGSEGSAHEVTASRFHRRSDDDRPADRADDVAHRQHLGVVLRQP
ncbi:protein of unknown function (plasmid) [Magnetospirillum sp. XM-1]|nr:protein of unknown function [Magnetospirillum sp. XM-1]